MSSPIVDYRDKTFDYDYIVEEFHYEYKLDVKKLLDILVNIQAESNELSVSDDVELDYYAMWQQQYPEVTVNDILLACNNDIDNVERYFYGYKNFDQLSELCLKFLFTTDPTERESAQTEFEQLTNNCDIAEICRNNRTKEDLIKYFKPHLSVVKSIYFVQSPKDKKTDLPSIHYSLKEKFLSDFRAIRSKVKKQMEKAEAEHDHDEYVRCNAKQLAIKKVCNSEYGASGNATFSHYDPDIAAAVTHCARSLIGFLTCNLESQYLYINKKFLDSHQKDLEPLISCGATVVEHDQYTWDELYRERRHVLRAIFNDKYEITDPDVYKLIMKPAKVVYQDTDSNYYINPYIRDYFTKDLTECSPWIIDQMMWAMYHHDMLLSDFAAACVARRPIGLGFEGSFIVCRYLNRKKRYYGKQWSADGTMFPLPMLKDDAYDVVDGEKVLKEHYDPQFIKKYSVLPYEDGTYISLDYDKLLRSNVNYLDYVKSHGVKCTGIDLVRRDQYKCVNFIHVYILKQDLQIMKYSGHNNIWSIANKNNPMLEFIRGVVGEFANLFKSAEAFVKNPVKAFSRTIKFSLIDFSKTCAYRPGKNNPASIIFDRITANKDTHPELVQYLPKVNERITYVILKSQTAKVTEAAEIYDKVMVDLNKVTRQVIVNNINAQQQSQDDMITVGCPESNERLYEQTTFAIDLQMPYEEFFNAYALTAVDGAYYTEKLCGAIALYVIGDVYPEEITELDSNEVLLPSEINAIVDKYQEKTAKMLFYEQYPEFQPKSAKKKLYQRLKNNEKAIAYAKVLYEIANPNRNKSKEITDRQIELFVNSHLNYGLFNSIEALLQSDEYNPTAIDEMCSQLARLNDVLKMSFEDGDPVTLPKDLVKINKSIIARFVKGCKDKQLTKNINYLVMPPEFNAAYYPFFQKIYADMVAEVQSHKEVLNHYIEAKNYFEQNFKAFIP